MAKINIVYKGNTCDECFKPASLVCEEYLHYFCEDHGQEEDKCPFCDLIRLIELNNKKEI